MVSLCHCRACQRRTGSAFGMQAAFRPSQVNVVGRFNDYTRISDEADYEAGKYAEAADRGREVLEAHPRYADLVYNVACCESLAGRTADALDHLGRAIAMSGGFCATLARDDSDFDPIRGEPAFQELVGR